jgi:hypothetical protein
MSHAPSTILRCFAASDGPPPPLRGADELHRSRGAHLLLPPACGEKVGMRGHYRSAQIRGHAPSPGLPRNPTSPRAAVRGKIESRSRGAPSHPSYGTPLSDSSPSDIAVRKTAFFGRLRRWSMLSCSRQMPVEAFASAALAWMTNGQERKKFGGETPTDARLFCRALRTRPRLKREAHIYRRSTAVLAPRSLSSQGTQPQAMLPGTRRGHVLRGPLNGRYPPLPVPVQRMHLAPRS